MGARTLCRSVVWVAAFVFLASEAAAAGRPFNPFGRRSRRYKYNGVFEFSDGVVIQGPCRLKGRKVFKIFDLKRGRHREFPLSQVAEIDCKVAKEWYEKIWRWKEEGEHVKIDTGKRYPVREFEYTMRLRPDEEEDEDEEDLIIVGHMSGVIFVQSDPRTVRHRDVYDWRGLCSKLKAAGEQEKPSPARRVWSLLPEKVQKLVVMASTQETPLRETRYEILIALDEALKRRDFYRLPDFAGVRVSGRAKELLAKPRAKLSDREVQILNRALLSAAFPRAIAAPRKVEEKLWYHSEVGDKSMIGKKLDDIVYIKKMVFTPIGAKK